MTTTLFLVSIVAAVALTLTGVVDVAHAKNAPALGFRGQMTETRLKQNNIIGGLVDDVNLTSNLDVTYMSGDAKWSNPCSPSYISQLRTGSVHTLDPICDSVAACSSVGPMHTTQQPHVSWQADFDALYTFAIVDMGVHGAPTANVTVFTHMLVTNVPGDSIASGDHLFRYFQPSNFNAEPHQYVFLVWRQTKTLQLTPADAKAFAHSNGFMARGSAFVPRTFAQQYALGAPIAVNFMMQTVDAMVPYLWHALTAASDTWIDAKSLKLLTSMAVVQKSCSACAQLAPMHNQC